MSQVSTKDAVGSSSGPGSGSGSGSSSGSGSGSNPEVVCRSGKTVDAKKAMEVQSIGPFENHGGCELRLVNVTATANMKCPINLRDVVAKARNAQYNPRRFSACIIRLINKGKPTATALVFKTGKVVVTGAKSDDAVDYVCAGFASILDKVGTSQKIVFNPKDDVKVQNMVATTDVGFPIRLEGLVQGRHGPFCNYEPELFPGLIYRLQVPKICVLIFVSGKVVLTGAKSAKQLEDAFKCMYPVLCSAKKETVLVRTPATKDPSSGQASKKRKT